MSESFPRFLALPDREQKDVFAATAARLGTLPSHVEKDFWVCLVLNALYNRMPKGHARHDSGQRSRVRLGDAPDSDCRRCDQPRQMGAVGR